MEGKNMRNSNINKRKEISKSRSRIRSKERTTKFTEPDYFGTDWQEFEINENDFIHDKPNTSSFIEPSISKPDLSVEYVVRPDNEEVVTWKKAVVDETISDDEVSSNTRQCRKRKRQKRVRESKHYGRRDIRR